MTDRIDTPSSLSERIRHLEMESKKLKAKPVDNTLDLKLATLKREIERQLTRDSISTVMHWTLTDAEITALFNTHSNSDDHTQYAAAEGSSITRSAKHATKTTAISLISDTEPSRPITGMVWIDTND